MTTPSNPPSSATRQSGGGQPTPRGHDPRVEQQPRHRNRDEQGEQWQHDERREQALITKASHQPGGVQRSTELHPDDQAK
jgi:hypothetical protein